MNETNDQTSTATMTAEMKARNYAELVYTLANYQSGGLTQPYDREWLIALAVWLNDEVAPALAPAEPARGEVIPCGVCGGTGRPASGKPCICDGAGTQDAELAGLRKLLFDMQERAERAEQDRAAWRETEKLTAELAHVREDAHEMRDALRQIGIFNSAEVGDDGSEWCVTLEPRGEEPAGTLDEALERTLEAAREDGRRERDEERETATLTERLAKAEALLRLFGALLFNGDPAPDAVRPLPTLRAVVGYAEQAVERERYDALSGAMRETIKDARCVLDNIDEALRLIPHTGQSNGN